MRRRFLAVPAVLTAMALGVAACGSDDSNSSSSGQTTSTSTATTAADASMTGADTPASTLRAGLTALLQEHVYLAGIAINQAVADGGNLDAPATASAVATLDANSVALSEAIASVYGEDAGAQFLDLWRKHIGFFVDYTLGSATNNTPQKEGALIALDAYGTEFGEFIETATNGAVPTSAVEELLATHVESLVAAIDAVIAGSPDAYPKLQEAASHMPMTASALAAGIAESQDIEGDVESEPAELRSGLTALLQEHVYLAGIAISQAVADGGNLEAPATASAVATLDANSVALSEAIASIYGEDAGAQFLERWRAHIGFFVDYTLGSATNNTPQKEGALIALDAYGTEFGEFIETATNGALSTDAVAAELATHVESLVAAIDAVIAGSPDAYPKLRDAAGHMPMTADALTTGILAGQANG
jgi:hypothetical protein